MPELERGISRQSKEESIAGIEAEGRTKRAMESRKERANMIFGGAEGIERNKESGEPNEGGELRNFIRIGCAIIEYSHSYAGIKTEEI